MTAMDLCQALRAYGFGPSSSNEAALVVYERLKAIVNSIERDPHVREDLVQEVLWTLHRSKVASKHFPTEAAAHSYLRVCLENQQKKGGAVEGRQMRAAAAAEDKLLHPASAYDPPTPGSPQDAFDELRREAERCFTAQAGIDREVYRRSLDEMVDLCLDRTSMAALAQRETNSTADERAVRNRITKRHSRVRELLVRWLLERIATAPTNDDMIRWQGLTVVVEQLSQRKSRH